MDYITLNNGVRMPQLGFGGVCGLLGQRAAQCVGRNTRRDIAHPGAADLGVHGRA